MIDKEWMFDIKYESSGQRYVHPVKPLELLCERYPQAFTPLNTILVDDFPRHSVFDPFNHVRVTPFVVRQDAIDETKYNSAYFLLLESFLKKIQPYLLRRMDHEEDERGEEGVHPFQNEIRFLRDHTKVDTKPFAPCTERNDLRTLYLKYWHTLIRAKAQMALLDQR